MKPRLVVALDVPDATTARQAASTLQGHADVLKIGLELFTATGPDLVREMVNDGWGVFLDLKLHDIPATVRRAVARAAGLGVELLTVHATGGPAMLEAAVAGRERLPRILAVTVLTSMDRSEMAAVGLEGEPAAAVERLCRLARTCGCDGVVASPREAEALKRIGGPDFLVVTPGIRPAGSAADDQARIATPGDAVRAGADYLVVGRPIMRAPDPAAAADEIKAQMEQAFDG